MSLYSDQVGQNVSVQRQAVKPRTTFSRQVNLLTDILELFLWHELSPVRKTPDLRHVCQVGDWLRMPRCICYMLDGSRLNTGVVAMHIATYAIMNRKPGNSRDFPV